MNRESDTAIKILWAICVIPLLIGVFMIAYATKDKIEYSTDDYWVAQNYHHVYEKDTGEIVDFISDNEECYIDGDIITVQTIHEGWWTVGIILTALFGMFTLGMIFSAINDRFF